ncbi:glycosyltransferase [Reichenbachiella carrageenanivorans]|uniref:Glycosyltransferase n=1 Tax=Reichenbachiella carrageenanivorans TaxID=2979869 RepID=A0ABY6D4M2_9BACT|nr:glycosyltransferase [Reichenbachiella carrageenanivorans]UXX81107.1 glycosyltransferase [Reichenbachiella carrageenanivorans]
MKLTGKNILLISPEPWDHIYVSKHHYARHLAERGNLVVFANPAGNRWQVSDSEVAGLQVLDYPKFVKGLRKLPSFVSQRLIKHKLLQIEKYCALKFDIIWSFDNSVFFDFTLLNTYNISHIVDLNQDFEIAKTARTADICLGNTVQIVDRLRINNTNAHFINHGLNQGVEKTPLNIKSDHLKIGYCGNLDIPYLDWDQVQSAFEELPNVDFYLAGNCEHNLEKIQHKNVTHLGKLNASQMASFYDEMDLLILCYLSDDYPDQLANPHKFMEYLATGKPIVASFTSTYADLQEIQMSYSQKKWLPLLKQTIAEYSTWNTQELSDKRKAIAKDNTYPKQIKRIEKLINEAHA